MCFKKLEKGFLNFTFWKHSQPSFNWHLRWRIMVFFELIRHLFILRTWPWKLFIAAKGMRSPAGSLSDHRFKFLGLCRCNFKERVYGFAHSLLRYFHQLWVTHPRLFSQQRCQINLSGTRSDLFQKSKADILLCLSAL